jgi:hypothetical protein
MRYFIPLLTLPILFTGCIYFNDTGISTHLYDNCQEYYDACGNYHRECPKNMIDYTEIKEKAKEFGDKITSGCNTCKEESQTAETGACGEPATAAY